MLPESLVAAVRERLDLIEQKACATENSPIVQVVVPRGFGRTAFSEFIEACGPAAVLRRVAAARRVLERHQPYTGDDGQATCEHCPADYEDELTPWPCPEFADLADGLGIDLEEET